MLTAHMQPAAIEANQVTAFLYGLLHAAQQSWESWVRFEETVSDCAAGSLAFAKNGSKPGVRSAIA